MKNLIKIALFFISCTFFAQTGPGGIGSTDGMSSLKIWYNPNNTSTVTTTSGNITGLTNSAGISALNLSATTFSTPNLLIGTKNGYDEMNFTGSKLLTSNIGLTSANFISNAAASFVVSNANNLHASLTYTTSLTSGSNRFMCHLPWSNGIVYFDLGNTTSGRIQKSGLNGLTNYNIWGYGGDSTDKSLYQNGTRQHFINSGASTFTPNATTTFQIGRNYSGQMTEVIVFNQKINNAQRIIIDNYLSAKYDIILTANNFYTQDDLGNGNFDHNVAGIGMALDNSLHNDSQGTGIVRINTPTGLVADEFLFWGEETKNPTYDFTTSSVYTERLNSKWRINERGDITTVNVSVKASDLDLTGKQSCATLKLILSNTSNFATHTTYNMVLSGGVYTATNVYFTNNDYFTFEYIDKIVVDATQYYNGSGFGNVPNTTDECYKLLVKSTATGLLPLTQGANVRAVEVEINGVLTVKSGLRLKVLNGLQLDGDIRLFGNSQLLQTHTGTSQVTGAGKLYMDKKGKLSNIYQSGFWTSPVTTTANTFTIASAMKDGTVPTSATSTPLDITFVTTYDGAATTPITISSFWLANLTDALDWNRHRSETATHNITEGYNMKSSGAAMGQNFTFIGKPNDGDYSSTITAGNSSLLGNPYPSALDGDVFILNNAAIFNTLYFWDGTNDNSNTHVRNSYLGGYATRAIGLGTPYNSGETPTRYISPAQGFFVDATTSGTINFKNSQRAFETNTSFFAKMQVFPVLRIGFEFAIDNDNIYHRQLAVGFRDLTNNYEPGYDAIMNDMRPTDVSLKVNNHESEFVIIGIEDYQNTIEIPLHVRLDEQRDVTFKVDAFENFTPENIYLKDVVANQYYSLENDVVLNLPIGDFSNRFFITFRNATAAINDYLNNTEIVLIDNTTSFNIYSSNKTIIKNISVYTVLGQTLLNKNTNDSVANLPITVESGQALLVKVTLENGQTIVKKLIKK